MNSAVISDPDLIDIDDIHEYPRETVKVEGVLTSSWFIPMGNRRVDICLMDGHSVVEVRWFVDLV